MGRCVRVPLLAILISCCVSIANTKGDETPPHEWRAMSIPEIAAAVRQLGPGSCLSLPPCEQDACKEATLRSVTRVITRDTTASYSDFLVLYESAENLIDDITKEDVKNFVCSSIDDWNGKTYAEFKSKSRLLERIGVDRAFLLQEVVRWIQVNGRVEKCFVDDPDLAQYRSVIQNAQVIGGSFSVEWNGLITASESGAHQFLSSSININAGYTHDPVKVAMSVSIDGEEILKSSLDAKQESWAIPLAWLNESNTVFLDANRPVKLKILFSVEAQKVLPSSTLHAMLFWKTPESKTAAIVPPGNLTLENRGTPGLEAKYSWSQNGVLQTFTRIEPNIDAVWAKCPIVLTPEIVEIHDAFRLLGKPATDDRWVETENGSSWNFHSFLKQSDIASASLTTPQRVAFLARILEKPALLRSLRPEVAVQFFRSFRFGAADQALAAFEVWANENADLPLALSTDRVFNSDDRYAFSTMATLITQQAPAQARELLERLSQQADGRCVLPMAYTLAYSQFGKGKLKEWIALLDQKLADPSLVGDRRVNWLIARAFTEEFDPASARIYPTYYGIPFQDPMHGMSYLNEALKAAETPTVKLRVAQEIAGRWVHRQNYQAAKDLLKTIEPIASAEQPKVVAGLLQQIDGFIANLERSQADQTSIARRTRLIELERRRDQALKHGDDKAADRYETLIGALSNEPSEN